MISRLLIPALALGLFVGRLNTSFVVAHDEHDPAAVQKADKKIADAIASLQAPDQKLAAAQRFCPHMEHTRLGAIGTPVKVVIEGKPVFVCCKSCVEKAKKDASATLKKAQGLVTASATLAKLPAGDRAAAEEQKYCAVMNKSLLGSMGAPIKLELDGKAVYLCCAGCNKKAQSNPEGTLARVAELKKAASEEGHDHADHKR